MIFANRLYKQNYAEIKFNKAWDFSIQVHLYGIFLKLCFMPYKILRFATKSNYEITEAYTFVPNIIACPKLYISFAAIFHLHFDVATEWRDTMQAYDVSNIKYPIDNECKKIS